MVYTTMLLMFFGIFIMIRNYKSRYGLFLFILVFGLDLAFGASTLYIAKNGNYQYPINSFFKIDYKIFLYMSAIKINYYNIIRLLNLGIALFIGMVPLFVLEYTRYRVTRIPWRNIASYLLILSFPIFYIWFYDPNTSLDFYFKIIDNQQTKLSGIWYINMIRYADAFNYCIIFIYLLGPFYLLYKYFYDTTLWIKKRQIISIGVNLLIFIMLFIFVFILGPFKEIYMYSYQASLLKFSEGFRIPVYYYNLMPAILFIIVQGLLIILFKFKGVDTNDFFMEIFINKNIKAMNENLRGAFHSFKNTLFSFKILAEQAQAEQNSKSKDEIIKRIAELSNLSMNNISRMLDALEEIEIKRAKMKVVDAVEEALKLVYINKGIIIKKLYITRDAYAFFDRYHFTEALANIFLNAVEAVAFSKEKNKVIEVEVNTEHEWVIIKIKDNGIGIKKEGLQRIFSPFYTTKSKKTNWGVGLSYVFRVVKAHLGYITVESVEGRYTIFQILLPKTRGDDNYE